MSDEPNKAVEAVIRLQFFQAPVLTTDEYEQLSREVAARVMAGDVTIAERVLYRVLLDNEPRYHEALATNEARGIGRSEP